MVIRIAEAVWQGTLKEGSGKMRLDSGNCEGAYSFSSRFESGTGTNPEELLGAAHAGCYSMALSSALGKAGYAPERIQTRARVILEPVEGKQRITHIYLETEVRAAEISEKAFQEIAQAVKLDCPVSVALSNVPITLAAQLIK